VISKRIDLVTLESHELVSTLIAEAGLVLFGAVVALAAWFAGLGALILYLMPGFGPILHLAAYAAVNAVVGAVVVAFALRTKLPTLAAEVPDQQPAPQGEQQPPDRREMQARRSSGD
jgi:hypothetical protein